MCILVRDIYSTHNLGKPNPEYEGQRRKKKNVNIETITSRSTEILPSRQAGKVEYWQAGKGWARKHNSVHVCFEVGILQNLGSKLSLKK